MPLTKAVLPRYGLEPATEIEQKETSRWKSGERMFRLDSKLRKEGLDVIAPPGVYLYQREFSRIYRRELFEESKGRVHLVFGANDESSYLSVIRERDIPRDGRIALANLQYISAIETLQFVQKVQNSNVAHIENFHRMQGDYPLAPEPTVRTDELFYMVLAYGHGWIPIDDRVLHTGVYNQAKAHPKVKFDVGFFSRQSGFPFSEKMDQDRADMLLAGILCWKDNTPTYFSTMDPEYVKDLLRKRLGHHLDYLFQMLAAGLCSEWQLLNFGGSKA